MAEDNQLQRMFEQLGGIGPIEEASADAGEVVQRFLDSESTPQIDAVRSHLKETIRQEWTAKIAEINQDVTDSVRCSDFLSAVVFAELSVEFGHSLDRLLLAVDSEKFAIHLRNRWQEVANRMKESVLARSPDCLTLPEEFVWPVLGKAKARETRTRNAS